MLYRLVLGRCWCWSCSGCVLDSVWVCGRIWGLAHRGLRAGTHGSPPGHLQLLASLIFDVFNNNDVSSPISTGVIATAKLPHVSLLAHSISAWPGLLVPFSAYDGVVGSQQPYWWYVWLSRPAATDKQHDLIRFSASRNQNS